jgi:hypothetical protein
MATTTERQRAFRDRMRAAGWTTETVWIPPSGRELLRSIARSMREMTELNRAIKEVSDKRD